MARRKGGSRGPRPAPRPSARRNGRLPSPPAAHPPPVHAAPGGPVIVGIGASAGGLGAFEAFFSGLPAGERPGMAFVLVQHLSPEHPSLLPELVRRFTHLPVVEAADRMAVVADTVYVIPPRWELEIRDGLLHLTEPLAARGHRTPIDHFFRSLALDRNEAAIAVVLSGTGSDGAQGVQAIKREGGLVLAQTGAGGEFDGMPHAALQTGMVDHALPADEMLPRLRRYAARAFQLPDGPGQPPPGSEGAMRKIFAHLRNRTGHDFSHYKATTVQRRVQRRMAVHQIEGLEAYASYLQQSPDEALALFRDLLIGVTRFFRDPEAFALLERQEIPGLLARRTPGQPIRIWVAGCSSGEEAFSIGMLLLEQLDEPANQQVVQIFATDIDARAIALARAGVYPAAIASDLSAERLARHFTPERDGSGYRVRKALRDLLIFSEHDLTRDPPFSRMDLISCRNLLIYLDGTLQRRIIPMFHYALKPDGRLFLGSSESIGDFGRLFEPVHRPAKLFRRLEDYLGHHRTMIEPLLQRPEAKSSPDQPPPIDMTLPKPSLRDLTERAILRELPVAAALVNAQGDLFYLHGRTGQYLEPTPGEAGPGNLLAMAREGLRRELALALAQTAATRKPSHIPGLRIRSNGHHTAAQLSVAALEEPAAGSPGPQLFLVMLQPATGDAAMPDPRALPAGAAAVATGPLEPEAEARIAALTQALRQSEEQQQALHEELESSIEELKSSSEEMQSVNEELQSTNEELQTSKEELQSVNEELTTVNTELEEKLADLTRANDDMNNLLAGTGIATVFVDHGLRILRFTPGASEIIPLIAGDIGRPVAHLASNLEGYDRLAQDTQAVLDSLIPKAHDVRTRAGRWFAMRIQPYRTLHNVIEGAVITFVDVTESVHTRATLRKVNEVLRLAVVLRDASDAITVHDLSGHTLAWNPAAVSLYGWSEAEALALNYRDRIPPALRPDAMTELRKLAAAEAQEARRTQRLTRDGRALEVWVKATALQDDEGLVYAIATTERTSPQD